MRIKVKQALSAEQPLAGVTVSGWVRTRRDAKDFSFVELNDGSCFKNLQVVVDAAVPGADLLKDALTGSSVSVDGQLVPSPAKGQKWELKATAFRLLGRADETFPLQKKGHTVEFLRSIPHLRARTNRLGSMMRVRSRMAMAVHEFFQRRGFAYVHTPIVTASDCEGAGELFRVTTLDPSAPARTPEGQIDWTADFFAKQAYLTVSGQLEGETLACALGDVYTFGPTFRAENSNTSRHLAEFWMVEPEIAFADLHDDANLAEALLKHILKTLLAERPEDMAFFDERIEKGLVAKLQGIVESEFVRMDYSEAITILEKAKQKFEFPVKWGIDLQSEHERYLTEQHAKKPVIVMNYPKGIKAFYMRLNEDDRTVAAMDVLAPGIGEIIGGSQREERLDVLDARMAESGLDREHYGWYRDLRRYGTVPHAGFGLGFERTVAYVTGLSNVRDVIPFPRTPGHARY